MIRVPFGAFVAGKLDNTVRMLLDRDFEVHVVKDRKVLVRSRRVTLEDDVDDRI